MTGGDLMEITDRLAGELHQRGYRVTEMLSREATLVSEIASMRAKVKRARQEAHAGCEELDAQWQPSG